ncbi:hypothetical protein RRSWK_00841 [Rhodopirellula sp. SWK7]|nr:hypothetical protein RRSWK_00841 [Rhodopirellula sp. SWK7]
MDFGTRYAENSKGSIFRLAVLFVGNRLFVLRSLELLGFPARARSCLVRYTLSDTHFFDFEL